MSYEEGERGEIPPCCASGLTLAIRLPCRNTSSTREICKIDGWEPECRAGCIDDDFSSTTRNIFSPLFLVNFSIGYESFRRKLDSSGEFSPFIDVSENTIVRSDQERSFTNRKFSHVIASEEPATQKTKKS